MRATLPPIRSSRVLRPCVVQSRKNEHLVDVTADISRKNVETWKPERGIEGFFALQFVSQRFSRAISITVVGRGFAASGG